MISLKWKLRLKKKKKKCDFFVTHNYPKCCSIGNISNENPNKSTQRQHNIEKIIVMHILILTFFDIHL